MANPTQVSLLIPTTQIWDVIEVYKTDITNPEQLQELLIRMYQNLGLMANAINLKDTGMYTTLETINSQQYFSNPAYNSSTVIQPSERQVFRKVINFGALPNAATKSVPHGITCFTTAQGTTFTRIYGVGNDTTNRSYIPLPYASSTAVANNLELYVDATNVNVATGANYSTYDTTYIVLEYLQN